MAVDGGENLADRLRLVGVKAPPEGTGCLYFISLCPEGGGRPLILPCFLSSRCLSCVCWEKESKEWYDSCADGRKRAKMKLCESCACLKLKKGFHS